MSFVLIFIKEQYNPDPLMLGLAAAGTQGGALIGALLGGWLSDKIGRRVMFLATMVLFIVLALPVMNMDKFTPFAPLGFSGISAAARDALSGVTRQCHARGFWAAPRVHSN